MIEIYPWQGYIFRKMTAGEKIKGEEKRGAKKGKRERGRENGAKRKKNKGWGKCKKKKIGKRDELVYGVLHSAIFLQICQKLL